MNTCTKRDLHQFWTLQGPFVDKNGDGVIDGTSLFIHFPGNIMPAGLLDFCARLGLETSALSFDLFEFNGQKMTMEFIESTDGTYAEFEDDRLRCFYENEPALSELLRELARIGESPQKPSTETPVNHIRSLAELWSFSGFGAFDEATPHHALSLNIQVAEAVASPELFQELCYFAARCGLYSTSLELPLTDNEDARIGLTVVPGKESRLRLAEPNQIVLSGTQEGAAQALQTLNRSHHWSSQGEFGYWEEQSKMADKEEAELWFETSWRGRSELKRMYDILEEIELAQGDRLEIFLSEPLAVRRTVQQRLRKCFPEAAGAAVRSAFKPGFHWIREELMPKLPADCTGLHISVQKESRSDGLELPIRWIQELYPIDRWLAEHSHLKESDIEFSLHDGQEMTYRVEALTNDGQRELLGELNVPVSRVPYVTENRFAYPSSGAVRVVREEGTINDIAFATDRERFYTYFLETYLPMLKTELEGFTEGQGHSRPLFDRLEIDVTMSEEEEKLWVDEERTSSMEALYEDLYFNTLDFFAEWGTASTGQAFNAPGGIHPFMHVAEGADPSAHLKVYRWSDKQPDWPKTIELRFDETGELEGAVVLKGQEVLLLPVWQSNWQPQYSGSGGRELLVAHSYQGRPVPVLEYTLASGETFDSPIKMTLWKKTLLIEAGHHANEISSTPAVLKLMEQNRHLLKGVNIVVIPNANPDGFALLQKMTREHPEWKHHAARYNAVGLEFAHIRYDRTIFGEADVLPQLMKRWAPDMIVDDHGIPAHEWVQPFAGYNSPPRFPVSYFLPSAKIYGIGRYPEGAGGDLHRDNLEAVVRSISDRIAGTDIAEANEYWKNRFTKYGHQWLPEVFPLEDAGHLHFYRAQSVTPEYPTVSILRYPDWIAADIISEAADEVVYGEALDSCIEAHILFNEGVLDLLMKQETEVASEGLVKGRERPMRFRI